MNSCLLVGCSWSLLSYQANFMFFLFKTKQNKKKEEEDDDEWSLICVGYSFFFSPKRNIY
ncbi:hypothetical protein LEMLEM_LOCUS1325 [Lemmus lemmus]